ncbi:benzoate transporter [Streptomyces sp. NPDC005393]|uniref:WD40 repeat domain-containing protein n=1 Tax=Streptomyces sp. NPDC005393 TaxID=3157041 RepID=UPI0033B23A3A
MSDAKAWAAADDAHRLIAKALAGLVAEDPTIPPHPYLSRHLADHAARGNVLDDAHVPLAVLPWESSKNVRTLLRQAGAGQHQDWLEAWAVIEPFVRDADPDSRLTSLHLAHHAATRRRTPLAGLPAARRGLAGSRITPLWSDWTVPGNVLAVSDILVESLAHTTTSDGRNLLISGDSHGTIRMWETHGVPFGVPLHTYGGAIQHLLPLQADLFVSGGTDGAVRVWDTLRGRLLAEPVRRPRTWVSGLTLHTPADAPQCILVAHSDGRLTALDTATFQPVDTPLPDLDAAPAILTGIGLAETDGMALAIAQGRQVCVWRPGQDVVRTEQHQDEVRAVVDLPVPGRYATCDDSGHIGFWDAATGRRTAAATPSPAGSVIALAALLVDGEQAVVSAGIDHTLRVWNADTGHPIGGALEGHTAPPLALTELPGDSQALVVSAGADKTLRRWKLAGHGSRPARVVRRPVTAAALPSWAIAAPSLLIAVADEAGTALWNAETGRHVRLPAGESTVTAFAWATVCGDPLLLTAHSDAGIRIWSLDAGNGGAPGSRGKLVNHSIPVQAMEAFTDGERTLLATGSGDGSVRLWDLGRQRQLARWDDHMLSVRDIAVLDTEDGALVVSAGADGTVRLWDPATGPSGRPPIHCGQQGVHTVATVPPRHGEAALIASGGEDGTVRLWDAATLRAAGDRFDAGDGPVTALVSFRTPAGRPCLAAAGPSGTIHVWDVTARTHLLRIVTGNPLSTLAIRRTSEPDAEHPVLLAAGTAGVCVFGVHLERY